MRVGARVSVNPSGSNWGFVSLQICISQLWIEYCVKKKLAILFISHMSLILSDCGTSHFKSAFIHFQWKRSVVDQDGWLKLMGRVKRRWHSGKPQQGNLRQMQQKDFWNFIILVIWREIIRKIYCSYCLWEYKATIKSSLAVWNQVCQMKPWVSC